MPGSSGETLPALPIGDMIGATSPVRGGGSFSSTTAAPGGGSSGPLRPQPASARHAISAPAAAMRSIGRSRKRLKKQSPPKGAATIAKPVKEAKSGFAFFELAQPFIGLRPHVFRRGAAVADAAFHRIGHRQDGEDVIR